MIIINKAKKVKFDDRLYHTNGHIKTGCTKFNLRKGYKRQNKSSNGSRISSRRSRKRPSAVREGRFDTILRSRQLKKNKNEDKLNIHK